jgi:RNA recognition motif-containing protein
MTNIYVGNLSFRTTQGHLQAMFSRFGNVERVSLVIDPYNGQSRGFAFVEMTQANEAHKAISELNGTDLHGRKLSVSEARPRPHGARKSSQGGS